MSSGIRTSVNSSGHLLTGYKSTSASGTYNFCIDKTDPSGGLSVSASPFNMQYQIWHSGVCGSGTNVQILNCDGVSAIETKIVGNPSAWYALTGAYNNGCFFSTLDMAGNVINNKAYLFPYPNTGSGNQPLLTESASTLNNYYVCGRFDTSIYVFKINSIGAITWSSYYSVGNGGYFVPKGIMECPFTGDLIVIGSLNTTLGYNTSTDGFLLKLNTGSGNVLSFKTYGMTVGACQDFNAIKPAYSNTGGQGYIIGGTSDSYPGTPWFLKLDINGNYVWTTIVKPSVDASSIPVGIIERLNSSSVYEYYGIAKSNQSGMVVIKLNDFGIPFTAGNNEFVYDDGSAFVSDAVNIDFQNSGPNIALTSYGGDDWVNGGNLLMVRSDFSGAALCNQTLTTVSNYYAGPNFVISPWINKYGSLTACNNFQINRVSVPVIPNVICLTTNEEYETDAHLKSSVSFFPNPVNGTFKFKTEKEFNNAELILFDATGQKVFEQKIIKKENYININGLPKGLYSYVLFENKQHLSSGKLVKE